MWVVFLWDCLYRWASVQVVLPVPGLREGHSGTRKLVCVPAVYLVQQKILPMEIPAVNRPLD